VRRALRTAAIALALLAGSCSRPAPRYYPLDPGLAWDYDVYTDTTDTRGRRFDGRSRLRVSNLDQQHIGAWLTTPQRMEFGGSTIIRYFAEVHDGVGLIAEQRPGAAEPKLSDPPDLMIPYPIRLGQTWDSNQKTEVIDRGTSIQTVESVESTADTITVPAGTFHSCLRVRGGGTIKKDDPDLPGGAYITLESTVWFAPEVGAVQVHYKETSNRPALGRAEVTYQLIAMSK